MLRRIAAVTACFGLLTPALCRPARQPVDLEALSGIRGAAPNSAQAFKFVVLSDRTGGHDPGVFEAAIAQVNLLKPDFVINVGDLIEGYTEDIPKINQMWDEMDGILTKLDAPFFFCPGNHDVITDPELQQYIKRHGVNGRTYYSFNYRGSHFVVLDSITACRKPEYADQMVRWLAADMAKAKDAQQDFVFFHYPQMNGEEGQEKGAALWARVLPLFPKTKTTVFNGHWHDMGAFDDGGVKSYVLADTGANPVGGSREVGGFRMYALVSVDRTKSSVAVLPVGEVRPISIAFDAEDLYRVSEGVRLAAVPLQGGSTSFTQKNPLDRPVKVKFQCNAPGWEIGQPPAPVELQPGGSQDIQLTLTPKSATPGHPALTATYEFTSRAGQPLVLPQDYGIGVYNTLNIPLAGMIQVDGLLDDWKGFPASRINSVDRVCQGRENWSGPADASFEWHSATDGQRLYVAVQAQDDQESAQQDLKVPCLNDAVEFFWDVRPVAERNGQRGPGTGQIILMLPGAGDQLVPKVDAEAEPLKSSLQTSFKRVAGGYVVEFSVPLKDLGMTRPVKVGEGINLEVMQDDRDLQDGKPAFSYVTTGGTGGAFMNTAGYTRGTFIE